MRLRTKLILAISTIIAFSIVIGSYFFYIFEKELEASIQNRFVYLAQQKSLHIDHILDGNINEATMLAFMPLIIDTIKESNRQFNKYDREAVQALINERDRRWIEEKKEYDLALRIYGNKLSNYLREIMKVDVSRYGEIFVTNRWGVTVAMSKVTSDYNQSDEYWWEYSYDNGKGRVFIDDRGFDESVKAPVVGIAVPVREKGEVIGVIKIKYKLKDILEIVKPDELDILSTIMLVRSQGDIIISSGELGKHEVISGSEQQLISGDIYEGTFEDIHMGIKYLMFFSKLKTNIFTRILNSSEGRGISGEKWLPTKWVLIVDVNKEAVLSNVANQKRKFFIYLASMILLGIVLAIIFVRSIIHPLIALSEHSREIAKGDLEKEVKVRSKDEVGQLAQDFDDMRLKLKESYRGLEDKVMEKTGEISLTVEKLQKLNEDLHDTQGAMLNLVEDLEDSKSKLEVEVGERRKAQEKLKKHHDHLEEIVQMRTAELEISNRELEVAVRELEAFSYSVSHDLKAPLRAINGFATIISEDYSKLLDVEGQRLLKVIQDNANNMGQLIEDILTFSRMGRKPIEKTSIDMERHVKEIFQDIRSNYPDRNIHMDLKSVPPCMGDKAMIKQLLTNLLSNSVKFTSSREIAEIEIGSMEENGNIVYYVKDNGVGFDMDFKDKLFGLFQRLHGHSEFEGTGVGLAIVQRLVHRHGGQVWAEGKVDEGATFFFTLGG